MKRNPLRLALGITVISEELWKMVNNLQVIKIIYFNGFFTTILKEKTYYLIVIFN